MKIRPANENDVKSIASLYVHNHRTTYKNLLPPEYFEGLTQEYAENKWADYIADKNNRVSVAEDETGFLGFAASMPDEELDGVWYLDSLHVREGARGKGVGTALIGATGRYALDNGYKKMSICIVRGNDTAGSLYRKLGASHYKYFTGKMSLSEKLIWEDTECFRGL